MTNTREIKISVNVFLKEINCVLAKQIYSITIDLEWSALSEWRSYLNNSRAAVVIYFAFEIEVMKCLTLQSVDSCNTNENAPIVLP